jgi:hypothetical protein
VQTVVAAVADAAGSLMFMTAQIDGLALVRRHRGQLGFVALHAATPHPSVMP